ncbi:ARRD2 protein, partial [Polypterus senegalus]
MFQSIRSFTVHLDGGEDAVFRRGEPLTGEVVLELARPIRVRSLSVTVRGDATVHWLENRSVGMNIVYNDYSDSDNYFKKRRHLIRGIPQFLPLLSLSLSYDNGSGDGVSTFGAGGGAYPPSPVDEISSKWPP